MCSPQLIIILCSGFGTFQIHKFIIYFQPVLCYFWSIFRLCMQSMINGIACLFPTLVMKRITIINSCKPLASTSFTLRLIFHGVACVWQWLADAIFCCWSDFYQWICAIYKISATSSTIHELHLSKVPVIDYKHFISIQKLHKNTIKNTQIVITGQIKLTYLFQSWLWHNLVVDYV